jgi:hypothetical protein
MSGSILNKQNWPRSFCEGNLLGYVGYGSKRRYLGPNPLTGEEVILSLKRPERFPNEVTFPLDGTEAKPGE